MAKIAVRDNTALNALYAGELAKSGTKTAANEPVQAFADHKEYESVMESVLADDSKESWDPNDEILD